MVSVDFHKRRNVVKKILISALVVAGLTFTGAASAKKLKFQMSSKAGDWAILIWLDMHLSCLN